MQLSPELTDLVVHATNKAIESILGTNGPLLSFLIIETGSGQRGIKEFPGGTTDEDLLRVASLEGTQRFVLLSSGKLQTENRDTPILLVHAAERGDPSGYVLAQQFQASRDPVFLDLKGQIEMLQHEASPFRDAPFRISDDSQQNSHLLHDALRRFAIRLIGEAFGDPDPRLLSVSLDLVNDVDEADAGFSYVHPDSQTQLSIKLVCRNNAFMPVEVKELLPDGSIGDAPEAFTDAIIALYPTSEDVAPEPVTRPVPVVEALGPKVTPSAAGFTASIAAPVVESSAASFTAQVADQVAAPVETGLERLTANLVTQQERAQGCVEASILLAVFWIVTFFVDSISEFTLSAGWTALGMFVLGVLISPSDKEMGDRKEAIEKLANKSTAKTVTTAAFLVLGLGLIVFSDDVYAWGKERFGSGEAVTENEEPSTTESNTAGGAASPKTTKTTPKTGANRSPDQIFDIPVGARASVFAVARFTDRERVSMAASHILASWACQSSVIEIPFKAAAKASSEKFAKLENLRSLLLLSPALSRRDIAAINAWEKTLRSAWYNSAGPTGRREVEKSLGQERPLGASDPARTSVSFFWTRSSAEKYHQQRAMPVRSVSAPPNLTR